MAHFSVWQRSPFKNNFIPSLRHSRQTGPMYLAIRFQIPSLTQKVQFTVRWTFVLLTTGASNASALRRPASIMRYRRPILNRLYFNSRGSQGAHSRFTAGAWSAHSYLNRSQPIFLGLVGSRQRRLLRGEWSSLPGPSKPERAGTRPGQYVSNEVREGDDGVVERRLDMHQAGRDNLLLFFL